MSKLQIDNLSFHTFGPFDLIVQPNQCIVISGTSGAGKSLLLRAIADLDPHEGMLLLDNQNYLLFPPTEWRKEIGLLPAESQWWYETVEEHFTNIEPAWFAQLGFDLTILKRKVSGLSTGERQRLALLRLLINKPSVLLLDEITANLDSENTVRIEKLIHTYKQQYQAAIIWVSHNAQQIKRIADKHFVLKDNLLTPAR